MFEPFPYFSKNEQTPKDGIFIKIPTFYIKHFVSNKERTFFNKIIGLPGWHISPSGFTCYTEELGRVIFGIRVVERFDRQAIKNKLEEKDFNPIFSEARFFEILNQSNKARDLQDEVNFNNQTIHEIRGLNKTIKSNAEQALEKISSKDFDSIEEKIKPVFSASSLITARLNTIDLNQNPELLGSKREAGIHNKFFKAARCLENTEKRVKIKLNGISRKGIDCYDFFDLLPVVLLENSVKYSPTDQTIDVTFVEHDNTLEVTISSLGPLLLSSEQDTVFMKGFRGQNAIDSGIKGSGIGLNLAKKICDLHNISMTVRSDSSKAIMFNTISYAPFIVILGFE